MALESAKNQEGADLGFYEVLQWQQRPKNVGSEAMTDTDHSGYARILVCAVFFGILLEN